jgi:curved DNA-binding protein CbpA
MIPANDPYRVLRIPRDAEHLVIRAAYRALAWQWHPDRGGAPGQMIQINEAWRILGDSSRRAAFDAAGLTGAAGPTPGPAPAPSDPGAVERPSRAATEPGVIDYGRYAGWSIDQLADHDPDFLEWLVRMPAGRQYAVQIREILGRREAQRAGLAPKPATRRGLFGIRTAAAP